MTEDLVKIRGDKLKLWLKNPYNLALIAIIVLAIVIRVWFFVQTVNQPVWWDEADYLSTAKKLAGTIDNVGNYVYNPRRPILLALTWSLLIRAGFGETSFRLVELLFSIAAVPAMYLVGKKLFNKKVGLIAAFLLAVFWNQLFLSFRLMTDSPTLTFFLFAVYFFWEAFAENKNQSYLWFGFFLGLSFLARAGTLVMFILFPIFLLLTKRMKIFKNKHLWGALLITLLLMGSFFMFIYVNNHYNPITHFLSLTPSTAEDIPGQPRGLRWQQVIGLNGLWNYFLYMPEFLGPVLLILFLIGLFIHLSKLVLGFDLIFKAQNIDYQKELFLFLWWAIAFFYFATLSPEFDPRYIIMAVPGFFILGGRGLTLIQDYLKKYSKNIAIVVVLILLAAAGYYQIQTANSSIMSKSTSYLEVKEAGLWIKANSNRSAIVATLSQPQNIYYSERTTYQPTLLESPLDNATEFEKQLNELKPEFLVLSVFESHPDWLLKYPSEHNDTVIPVKVYTQNNQPVLIIYKLLYPNG